MKEDIFAIKTQLSDMAGIKTQMSKFQDNVKDIAQMFQKWVTNKALETHLDHHQIKTSFLGFDHLSSFFKNYQSHSLGDMHHGHRGPKLEMHKFDGNDPTTRASQMEQTSTFRTLIMILNSYK